MDNYIPVKENPDFVQDIDSYALLFNNLKEFQNYEGRILLSKRIDKIEEDIKKLFLIIEELTNKSRENYEER